MERQTERLLDAPLHRLQMDPLVDADTWYEPAFLPALLHYAVSRTSPPFCLPKHHRFTFFENLLLPYAFGSNSPV